MVALICFQGTDQSFVDKCHVMHGLNLWYDKPRMSLPEFSIKHYAGKVTYDVSEGGNDN